MAIVDIDPTVVDFSGAAPVYNSGLTLTDTFRVRNPGGLWIYLKQSGGGAVMTVDVPSTVAGQAVPDFTYTIPAGGELVVAPLPPGVVNDEAGNVVFTFSTITGVSFAAIQFGG